MVEFEGLICLAVLEIPEMPAYIVMVLDKWDAECVETFACYRAARNCLPYYVYRQLFSNPKYQDTLCHI